MSIPIGIVPYRLRQSVFLGLFYPGDGEADTLLAQILGRAAKRLKESDQVRDSAQLPALFVVNGNIVLYLQIVSTILRRFYLPCLLLLLQP